MKLQHHVFVLQMIKHGDKIQAYRAAYPKCANDETARKSAERLLRHHPEIAAEIKESAAYIRQRTYAEAYREFAEQQKTPLLSMMKRREILAQIATSEMKVGRFVKDGDRYKMLFEDQRPRDMMRAMEIDLKMEEACNRMRNCNDPYFSQFNIYIDGRPCDQPHLPPDPNLPPGIFMLHRSQKKFIEGTGINRGTSSMPQIETQNSGINLGTSSSQQIENQNSGIIPEHLSRQGGENTLSPAACPAPCGSGGVSTADGGGLLAPDKKPNQASNTETNLMPQMQNQNPGIIWEHSYQSDMQNHLSPAGGGGEVRAGGGTLAPDKHPNPETNLMPQIKNQNPGIIPEQNQITSPLQGDLGVNLAPEQNALSPAACPAPCGSGGVSSADGGGLLAPEKSLIENPGIIPEHLSRQGGENTLSPAACPAPCGSGGVSTADGGETPAPDKNQNQASNTETNLMPQMQNQNPGIIWEHSYQSDMQNHLSPAGGGGEVRAGGGTLAENPDPLAASFYKQELQALASAPPPHILTPEEVKALDEEYARQHADKPLKPSTFGKMYFKEKGMNYDNIE